jgi:hypothetical protein
LWKRRKFWSLKQKPMTRPMKRDYTLTERRAILVDHHTTLTDLSNLNTLLLSRMVSHLPDQNRGVNPFRSSLPPRRVCLLRRDLIT